MLSEEKHLELHRLFYNQFYNTPASGKYISYEDHAIPSHSARGTEWMIFHAMADEYDDALKNEINGLLTNIAKLQAWSQIEEDSQFDLDLKIDFWTELFDPVASSVLNTPYIVSQRFIYCSTMLLHQTRMIVDPGWQDSQLKEAEIRAETLGMFRKYFESLDRNMKRVFRKLLSSIDKIGQFSRVTGNYRTLYHHRIRRHIGVGISSLVTRIEKDDGTITYGFGGVQPIQISPMLPEICKQHEICVQAFDAYWNLVTQLLEIWKRHRPDAKAG